MTPSPPAHRIRPARPGDEHQLIDLVRELASFERAADQVRADADALRQALFAAVPSAWCHVAEAAGTAENAGAAQDAAAAAPGELVGMALWFPTFSTWTGRAGMHLEDLYVRPAGRGRGVGRALLGALAEHCLANGWPRLEWAVLDWNSAAIGFYRRVGAQPLDEWRTYRLTGRALVNVAGRG